MIAQFRTEAVMRERLAELGHRPHFGRRLAGFEQDESGVTARIVDARGKHLVRARFLIGTDGGRSFVRHALNIGFPGETLGVRALVADVRLEGLDRLAWHRFQIGSPATQFMVCPLAGTDLFQLQGPVPLEGDIDLSPAALTELIARRTGRSDIVVHAVSWASVYSMNARLADRYRVGRVFLAGDAAHTHPPTGGKGSTPAYRMPTTLAGSWQQSSPARRIRCSTPMRKNGGPSRQACWDCPRACWAKPGKARCAATGSHASSTLAITHPRCPARRGPVKHGSSRATARLTRHAGDGPVSPHDCSRCLPGRTGPCSVSMPLNAPRAGLRMAVIGEQGDLIDDAGHIADAYGLAPGQWALVRPDGYLAAIIDTNELDQTLQSYQSILTLPWRR
jgi:hypothetical protein